MNSITKKKMGISLETAARRYVEFGLLKGKSDQTIGATVAGIKSAKKATQGNTTFQKANRLVERLYRSKNHNLFN